MSDSTPVPEPASAPFRINPRRAIVEKVVAIPRKIARPLRVEMASIIAAELVDGDAYPIRDSARFIQRYGIFYPVLIHLHHSGLFMSLQDLAVRSPQAAVPIAQVLITKVFDLIERYPAPDGGLYAELDGQMKELLAQNGTVLDGAKMPGGQQAPDDMLVSILTEFSGMLSLLVQEPGMNPDERQKILDKCSDTIATLEKQVSEKSDAATGMKPGEIQDLIDEMKKALDELKKDGVSGDRLDGESPDTPDKTEQESGTAEYGGSGQGTGERPATSSGKEAGAETGNSAGWFPGSAAQVLNRFRVADPRCKTTCVLSGLLPGPDWSMETVSMKTEHLRDLEYYAQISRQSDELKAVLRQIGRVPSGHGIRNQAISPMGKSEMYSLTRSDDIARLLPSEAVKLRHPVFHKKFYADFTEGKLLTYQLQGKNWTTGLPKKKKQGPVIVLVDTSGSMHGTPEIIAKSVVLALAKLMLRQNRDVKVVLFSGPGNIAEIELTSTKKMVREFLSFLTTTFGGGTDFNTALKSGLRSIKQPAFRGADLLFITDGVSDISDPSSIREWKKVKEEQKARVFSLIIGSDDAGGLAPVSDYTYFIYFENVLARTSRPGVTMRLIASPNNPRDWRRLFSPTSRRTMAAKKHGPLHDGREVNPGKQKYCRYRPL